MGKLKRTVSPYWSSHFKFIRQSAELSMLVCKFLTYAERMQDDRVRDRKDKIGNTKCLHY
jgi:hypothetical protein